MTLVSERKEGARQPWQRQRLADSAVWLLYLSDPDDVRVELCFEGADAA